MITVIKLQGSNIVDAALPCKAPSVSYVSVHIFDTEEEALEFCEEHTIDSLYWSYAAIVLPGEAFEVGYPFGTCDSCKNNGGTRGVCQNETCNYEKKVLK